MGLNTVFRGWMQAVADLFRDTNPSSPSPNSGQASKSAPISQTSHPEPTINPIFPLTVFPNHA
jgi:hypothetical protein